MRQLESEGIVPSAGADRAGELSRLGEEQDRRDHLPGDILCFTSTPGESGGKPVEQAPVRFRKFYARLVTEAPHPPPLTLYPALQAGIFAPAKTAGAQEGSVTYYDGFAIDTMPTEVDFRSVQSCRDVPG